MTKRNVFYSFHFDNDVFRVQIIRNMGIIDGDEPVNPNTWEQLKRTAGGVERWIEDNMRGRSCVVVLIGTETHRRPWVRYEIEKAQRDGKALLGIYIHNLNCARNGTCSQGVNPLTNVQYARNGQWVMPRVYNPSSSDAYNDIKRNLSGWIESAIAQ